jgi:CheY-like chemotaxis protein
MTLTRSILLVESDTRCGQALARVLRRNGHRVRLARTAKAAATAAQKELFDLAIVDLMIPGGGADLGRQLSQSIPRLYLSIGAHLLPEEIIEVALGFPVLRKAAVPALLGAEEDGNGNGVP